MYEPTMITSPVAESDVDLCLRRREETAVGRIQSPELAEDILKEGKADLIGLGRALICDPEFPNKLAQGKAGEIRR